MAKSKRKSISKKVRFEVFKRDSFKCQYCGDTPPKVVLELDHINPVSKGGDNDIDNLVAACFDCNRGKSDKLLTTLPKTVEEKRLLISEKEEQIKAFKNLQKQIKSRTTRQLNSVRKVFQESFDYSNFSKSTEKTIRLQFIPQLPHHEIEDSMELACERFPDDDSGAVRYFFGICWNKIKGEHRA